MPAPSRTLESFGLPPSLRNAVALRMLDGNTRVKCDYRFQNTTMDSVLGAVLKRNEVGSMEQTGDKYTVTTKGTTYQVRQGDTEGSVQLDIETGVREEVRWLPRMVADPLVRHAFSADYLQMVGTLE